MINLREISVVYGDRAVLDGVSAVIGAQDRLGLVGPNGAGKSTLLKVLLKQIEPDRGAIEMGREVSLGHLPQEIVGFRGRTLLAEAEDAFPEVVELRKKVASAGERLAGLPSDGEAYHALLHDIGEWEHRLEELEADKLEARIKQVLAGLGFAETDAARDCGEFSGGWQMRIALAKLLLAQPSLLLLDEPTNHLDIDSLAWLENYLKNYPGAFLLVSHDRRFLDELTTRTFALRRGRLEVYSGNYRFFEKESVERREQLKRAAANQQKQIAKTEEFIERFRYKATKATQVQSRIKQLDKVERLEIEDEEPEINFRFPEPPRGGQVVLELDGVRKCYGHHEVFRSLDFKLERGQRLAVVGPNGAGKSTFVKVLADVTERQSGVRTIGHNVQVSYFAQHQADELDPSLSALESVEAAAPPGRQRGARDLLGAFLFTGDDALKKVRVLSGGEKNRVALARMLVQPFNCLILDEPTNHLDMRGKAVLQEALRHYPGTFVIVSHDRDFLDPLVTQTLEVRGGRLRLFEGNVSDYLEKIAAEQAAADEAAPNSGKHGNAGATRDPGKERRRAVAERNRRLAPLRKKSEQLEGEIERLEAEQAAWEEKMADPAFFQRGETTREEVQAYEAVQRRLERSFAEWENLQDQIAALSEAG